MIARVGGGGDDAQHRPAINRARGDAGPGEARHGIGQRVLIKVGDLERDVDGLAEEGDQIGDGGEHRRLVGARHRDHEGRETRHGWAARVGGIGGDQAHGVIAAVAGMRRHGDAPGAVAMIHEADEGRHRESLLVVDQAERQRPALRIGGGHIHRPRRPRRDRGIAHRRDLGRPVERQHRDRHRDGAGQRFAGAVAVIRGEKADRERPGLAEHRGPAELQRPGIESGARGERTRRHHRHGGGEIAQFDQVARRVALRRLIAGVVRVEGGGAEGQGLALEGLPPVLLVEHRRAVGVEHRPIDRLARRGDAIRH